MEARLRARLELARDLRQRADHSSEQELRDALSRSYYSLYHASIVLLRLRGVKKRKFSHEKLPGDVGGIKREWTEPLRRLRDLRNQADYDPLFVARRYGGNPEEFRVDAFQNLEAARNLYRELVIEIEK